ncbi:hypothetical protein [Streptomyces altiplanensis]
MTLTGVQTFHHRGEQRHCLPGERHVLHPDELRDGAAVGVLLPAPAPETAERTTAPSNSRQGCGGWNASCAHRCRPFATVPASGILFEDGPRARSRSGRASINRAGRCPSRCPIRASGRSRSTR